MRAFIIENLRWIGAGMLLSFASSFGQTWFISLFADQIREAAGVSIGGWGLIYTVATLGSAVLLLSRGGLADTIPFSRLTLWILGLYALAAFLMSVLASPWLLVPAVFLLRFCGQGMMFHIAMTAIGRWFQANRGRAVSLAGLGHSFGEMILPVSVVTALIYLDWRVIWLAIAALLILGFAPLLGWLLSQPRIPKGAEAASEFVPGLEGRHWTRAEMLRHGLFWAFVPGIFTPGFVGTVVVFHQVHLARVKSWSLIEMAPALTLYAMMAVAASLTAGWAADRYGPSRLLPLGVLPMGLGAIIIGTVSGVWAWYAGLMLAGMTFGIALNLWNTLFPQVYGTRHLGSLRAVSVVVMVAASAIGPGVTGILIDAGVGFPAQCVAMGLWSLALSAAYLSLPARIRRAEQHVGA